jgi:hypothetical protein
MKNNKKASGKISRRNFAKTVATSIIAAPIISAHSQEVIPRPLEVRTLHIPPIEITSGSVTLNTAGDFSDVPASASSEQPRKQVFDRWKNIEWVRVTLAEGITAINLHKNNPAAKGGQIEIWVNNPNAPMPDIVLKPTTNGPFQVEFTSGNTKFERDNSGPDSLGRGRYNYNGSNTGISKVVVRPTKGKPHVVTRGEEIEIKSILIWPAEAIPHGPHPHQNKEKVKR